MAINAKIANSKINAYVGGETPEEAATTHAVYFKGDPGPAGPAGPAGKDGKDGKDGVDGAAATIAVGTTTTGNPGTSASVSNSGTSSAAVFNFTIPKGDKGDPGEYSSSNPPPYPVTSVNSKTGAVTVSEVPAGGATGQVLTKDSNDDNDVSWQTPSVGSPRNIWYAACTTATGTADKVATSATGDFVLAEGNMCVVKFTYYNNQTEPYLSIDGCTKKRIKERSGTGQITTALWRDGECVTVAYDGTDFIVVEGGTASTSYYGVTKLSNSYSSTSQSLAATPQAVKAAYDLAASKVDAAGAAAAAPVQSVNGQTGAVTISVGGITIDTLWTNASPTSNFAAQSVPCDLTGYDYYAVRVKFGTAADARWIPYFIFDVDTNENLTTFTPLNSNNALTRTFTYDSGDKEVDISDCRNNGTASNSYAIPVYIKGIKL